MVTFVRVPGPTSLLTPSLFPPGQLLLADHCFQDLPNPQQLAEPKHQADPAELISAAVPRVSCCLLEASMALSDKRIEDLCAQLMQASALLNEVLAVVSPETFVLAQAEAVAAEVEAPSETELPPIAEDVEITSTVPFSQALAVAA